GHDGERDVAVAGPGGVHAEKGELGAEGVGLLARRRGLDPVAAGRRARGGLAPGHPRHQADGRETPRETAPPRRALHEGPARGRTSARDTFYNSPRELAKRSSAASAPGGLPLRAPRTMA